MPPKGQIFKINVLESLLASENSCVSLVPCTRLLAVPPFFLNDMKSGIIYLLNSFLKKYDRALNGIPIGYQKVKVLMDENTGIIRMGNAETEVNVSVEFYIFQPKIGSSLLGVINKKSKTHIGCLVHKYFNATILKPENVEYEDWICKDLNVNDTIVFKVKDLDFTALLPYIEGIIDDENFVCKKNQELENKKNSSEVVENNFTSALGLIKNQKEMQEEDDGRSKILDGSLNNLMSFDESDARDNKKKKKKKVKDKIQKLLKDLEEEKLREEVSQEKEAEEGVERKKKKKRKSLDEEEVPPTNTIESVTQDNEQSDQHQFVTKRKKKKKDKKNESNLQNDSLKNGSQHLSLGEDSIFYSTQLEPSKPLGKPSAPFCSPIPQVSSLGQKKNGKQETSFSNLNTWPGEDSEAKKNEKKSKKKRKKEHDEGDGRTKSKEPKVSSEKVEDKTKDDQKSQQTVQELLNKIFKEQMNRINQESASDRETETSLKTKKKKNKTLVENKDSDKSLHSSRSAEKKKKERDKPHQTVEDMLEEFLKQNQTQKKKTENVGDVDAEKTNQSLVESSKSSRKSVEKKKKERDKSQPTILDLFKGISKEATGVNRHDSVSDKESKTKEMNALDEKKEEKEECLYEKLLKEARNSISASLPDVPSTGPLESETKKKQQKSELKTNTQTNESKLKRKRETLNESEGPSTPKKLKNGNMYDYNSLPTPQKVNPDKSLFSDSETSTKASPVKKEVKMNGLVSEEKEEPSSLDKVMKKLIKEQKKRLESETESVGKEGEGSMKLSTKKEKKKKKKKEEPRAEESLYEKLLKNARNSINLSEEV